MIKSLPIPKDLPTFSTVLSGGKEVTMRQALTQDILYLSNVHGKKNELEQGMYMMVRLSVGKDPLTLEQLQLLPVKDLYRLGDLVSQCTGESEADAEEASPLE